MRRIFVLLIMIALAGGNSSFAQSSGEKIKYGVKAGINAAYFGFSSAYKRDAKDDGFKTRPLISFHVGGYADYALTDAISLQGGLTLSGKGGRETWSGEDDFDGYNYEGSFKESLLYLEIPVNAVYKKGKFFAGAGPYVGYALSGKWKETYEEDYGDGDTDYDEDSGKVVFSGDNAYRKWLDAGINLLAGYQITDKISVGANFGMGLINLSKSKHLSNEQRDYWSQKNRVFSVSVGYVF